MVAARWAALSEGLPRPFWALLLGTFITKCGAFVVPMLFVVLTQARGLSLVDAGRVASLYGFGSLVGVTLGGVLADRIGRRVTMLGSLLGGAACMLVLASLEAIAAVAVFTFLLGLTTDAWRPASQALVADLVEPAFRMKAFALQYWAINLGFTVASVVGGALAMRSFELLFVGDAITTLVLAAVVALAVPETRPAVASTALGGSLLTPFVDRRFLPFLVLNFLMVLVFFQHASSLPEDMRAKGLTPAQFGLAVATNGALIVVLQPLVTRGVAGVSRPVLLAVAALLTGIGFGLTPLATTLVGYAATVAVWTLGEILFAPVNASLVADLSPPHLRGRYQGAFGLTWALAFALAPLVGPPVIEAGGLGSLWAACLGMGVVVAVGHLVITRRVLAGLG